MKFSESTTPGWSMMTSKERKAYSDKMRSFLAADECRSYHQQHMAEMQERAQKRGRSVNPVTTDPCTMLQQQGIIN